jgi:transposase
MPWKETCAVSERIRLVELVREGVPVAEAARLLCISRQTAHKWLLRQEAEGLAGLADRSRARHTQALATRRRCGDFVGGASPDHAPQ